MWSSGWNGPTICCPLNFLLFFTHLVKLSNPITSHIVTFTELVSRIFLKKTTKYFITLNIAIQYLVPPLPVSLATLLLEDYI